DVDCSQPHRVRRRRHTHSFPTRRSSDLDHQNPTDDELRTSTIEEGARQIEYMKRNCADFGIELYAPGDGQRGIAHVIALELGLAQPGMTLVCCDSHTSTNGAFGVLAFGI